MEELQNPLLYIPQKFKVLSKPTEQGRSELVPMALWPSQEYYIKHRTNRDIILKSRQTGMSTGILAANSHALFNIPYERQVVIAHDDETASFLLQTVHRFRDNLPSQDRPKVDWKSGSRMRFPVLDGYIYIDSAKSESIGIGRSLTRAHLSEIAKWPSSKEHQLFADVSQTVAREGFITIESTPRGRGGLFYELCNDAKDNKLDYKFFFFPWWWDVTCIAPELIGKQNDDHIEKAAFSLGMSTAKYIEEESALRNRFHLNNAQLSFRRSKIQELKALFFQEYPENDTDCWLSGELSVIEPSVLRYYQSQIIEGRQEGNLTIWKDVLGGHSYKVGVDVAAGLAKGDYSVASVLDTRKCEYVARLRGRIPPDLFTEEVYRLGQRYNNAELGVETAGHGHVVLRILLEKNYPSIYMSQGLYDEYTKSVKMEYGWKTSVRTKPMMISTIRAMLRSGELISYSENLLREASGIIWDGPSETKIKRTSGSYDDEWDALSIALLMRELSPIDDYESRPKATQYARI